VVLVDDAEEVASALGDFLSTSGVQAVVAFRADDALDAIRRDPDVTVLVSDVRMPGKDGFTLAREVQALRSEKSAIEIVLITAHASHEGIASAAQGEIFEFLEKPFRPHRLAETVRRAHEKAIARRSRYAEHLTAPHAMPDVSRDGTAGRIDSSIVADPGDLLRACASSLQGLADQAGLRLSVISETSEHLAADTDLALCGRALDALVKEAILLSPRGSAVELSARSAPEGIEFAVEHARVDERARPTTDQHMGRSGLLAEAGDLARRLAAHLVIGSAPATVTTPYRVCLVMRAAERVDRSPG